MHVHIITWISALSLILYKKFIEACHRIYGMSLHWHTAKLSKTNAYVKLSIWLLIWIRLIIALVPPSKDDPTTAAKKTQAAAKKSQNLTLWNATCYFLSLPKRSILELETQISNAVDNSTKYLFVSSMVVGSFCCGVLTKSLGKKLW